MTEQKQRPIPFVVKKQQTLEDATYNYLRATIVAGEFAPGTRLVGSRLASTLHVSRLTVANALKRLISEGFVLGSPNRETTVAVLNTASLREIFLIRHALEEVVMQEVVTHITPTLLLRLHELNGQLHQSIEQQDSHAYRRIEREFHLLIYMASGLPMMTTLLTDLWDRLEPYRGRRYSQLHLNEDAYTDHLTILSALEVQDIPRFCQAMREHIDHGYSRFQLALADESPVPKARSVHEKTNRNPSRNAPFPDSLRAALDVLPDKRRGQGKLHAQSAVLALAVCAMLCGVQSRHGVARWGQRCHPMVRQILGLVYDRGPSIATVHRVFYELDQSAFVDLLTRWFNNQGIVVHHPVEETTQIDEQTKDFLPGIPLITGVAHQLYIAFTEHTSERYPLPSPHQALLELPQRLLAGKAVDADVLLAQRHFIQHVMTTGSK